MQNDRDTATHDRESANSSAAVVVGHADGGKTLVAPVDSKGCELILSSQWPWGYRVMVIFTILPLSP